ncbi:nucleolin-like [Dorcoceras hygrometricum]|uniref:Nucleolin-like n=1 Tax=Dorcoceras hygrometricum TaxID=472368 RepID=A0A2Z7CVQ6_9LAMI|nr:nucleolin-like [Dorcoceras hygrometricum]
MSNVEQEADNRKRNSEESDVVLKNQQMVRVQQMATVEWIQQKRKDKDSADDMRKRNAFGTEEASKMMAEGILAYVKAVVSHTTQSTNHGTFQHKETEQVNQPDLYEEVWATQLGKPASMQKMELIKLGGTILQSSLQNRNAGVIDLDMDIHACLRAVNPRQRCIDSYMNRGLTQSRRLVTPSESANGSNIGYPRMRASGESSTTKHRLLHASGSHPIPPPNDPNSSTLARDLYTIIPSDSIGYPRMRASGESSTTKHRLLHASGSHPIPPPNDPKTNQYNQDLGLIHSTNGNHLESPNEGSSIDHQVTIHLHAQNITMFPTNETWFFASQMLVSSSGGLILILMAQSTRNKFRKHSDY